MAAACLWAAALSSCTKEGGPSAEYAEARAEFNQLYAKELEDAYVNPAMKPIEEKLARVPQDSEDSIRAQELLRRIRSGRERVEARLEERRAELERVARPQPDVQFSPTPPELDGGPEVKEPDAGPSDQPAAGMPLSELRARFGMCFEPGEPLDVVGRGRRETFVLRNMEVCRQRHPGFDQRLVIAEGDRILFIGDRKDVQMVEVDAGR